jgi:uncharacterized membrane protein
MKMYHVEIEYTDKTRNHICTKSKSEFITLIMEAIDQIHVERIECYTHDFDKHVRNIMNHFKGGFQILEDLEVPKEIQHDIVQEAFEQIMKNIE